MSRSRLAGWALAALCALAPAVYTVKAIVRPGGDAFSTPARVPAVPVLLVTMSSVALHDLAGARGQLPMPALTNVLRESEVFPSVVCAGNDDAASMASILFGSLPGDHGVRRFGDAPAETINSLTIELHGVGYRTIALLGLPFASACNLGDGFDVVRDLGAAPATAFVDELDSILGEPAPPRFFAWLDLRDAHRRDAAGGSTRGSGLRAIDAAIARLDAMLGRRRLASDCLLVLASDHGDDADPAPPSRRFADAVVHGVAAMRFPFDKQEGTFVPTSIATIDLAPTILALLRVEAPANWRGKNRLRDLKSMKSSGPAIGGPFHRDGASPVWVAEEGSLRLAIAEDGTIVEMRDVTKAAAAPAGTTHIPDPFLPLAVALRGAIVAKTPGVPRALSPEVIEALRREGTDVSR